MTYMESICAGVRRWRLAGWRAIVWICAVVVLSSVPTSIASAAVRSDSALTDKRDDVIVLMGASYAKDWPIQEIDGMRVINRGIGGEETYKMLARFEEDVIRIKPAAVMIWGYANDIVRSPRENVEITLQRTRSNIMAMVQAARRNGIQPILVADVTWTSPAGAKEKLARWVGKMRGKKGYHEYVNEHIFRTNEWIREYGQREGILVLDFESVVTNGNRERFAQYAAEDGSHISKAGYDALSAYVRQYDTLSDYVHSASAER
jgi:lysophospholipase L1-like esterase